jgi:hypothetical protein
MSQSTIAQPTTSITPTRRRVSALLVAVIALVATVVLAIAVFAWSRAADPEPAPATLPSAESDQISPSSDADVLPTDGVPVLYENCDPRQVCAY